MVEGESVGSEEREKNVEKEEQKVKDLEKGEVGFEEKVVESDNNLDEFQVSRFQRLNVSNPLRIALNASTRVATPSPSQFSQPRYTPSPSQFSQASQPRSTPTPQVSFFLFHKIKQKGSFICLILTQVLCYFIYFTNIS